MIIGRIIAIVVTYNRLNLLQECIYSLRNQSYKVDSILVVNNKSTDDTENWLSSQTDLIVINQENLGGAGGFNAGLKLAYQLGYDYFWLMDDDVEPDIICLENMIEIFSQYGNEYGVLLPDRYVDIENNKKWQYGTQFNFKNPFRSITKEVKSADNLSQNSKLFQIVSLTFEGPLIKRDVLEIVGNVNKEMFIALDDTEYSIRIYKNNIKMGVVADALIYRKININFSAGVKTDFKLYYLVRNSIYLDKLYGGVSFALLRSFIFIVRLFLSILKSKVKCLDVSFTYATKIIFKGFVDGFSFKPLIEKIH